METEEGGMSDAIESEFAPELRAALEYFRSTDGDYRHWIAIEAELLRFAREKKELQSRIDQSQTCMLMSVGARVCIRDIRGGSPSTRDVLAWPEDTRFALVKV